MVTYFERQLEEIDHAIHSIDLDIFEKMVACGAATVRNGHKIIVTGLGKNVPICEKVTGSLLSLGIDAYFLHTNSAIHGDMGVVKDGDMIIILTKSGETKESIYLEECIRNRDIKKWLITFEKDSTLSRIIEDSIIVDLIHEGDLWNIMPNNSTTVNLIILQGFVMKLAKELDLKLDDFKRNHPGGHIGDLLKN